MTQLVVENLEKTFLTRAEPLVVLRSVQLQLTSGQNVAVLGPSGSGKSTLLNIIGTLERPTSGTVKFDGTDPTSLGERALAKFRNDRVGFVFQDSYLLPQCSVLENVLVPSIAAGPVSADMVERAKKLLGRVGLTERLNHRPPELSGGERQRTAIARALINSPDILLADEPTGNLDRKTTNEVGRLLLEIQREGKTMLIVATHNLRLARILDCQLTLEDGLLKN